MISAAPRCLENFSGGGTRKKLPFARATSSCEADGSSSGIRGTATPTNSSYSAQPPKPKKPDTHKKITQQTRVVSRLNSLDSASYRLEFTLSNVHCVRALVESVYDCALVVDEDLRAAPPAEPALRGGHHPQTDPAHRTRSPINPVDPSQPQLISRRDFSAKHAPIAVGSGRERRQRQAHAHLSNRALLAVARFPRLVPLKVVRTCSSPASLFWAQRVANRPSSGRLGCGKPAAEIGSISRDSRGKIERKRAAN